LKLDVQRELPMIWESTYAMEEGLRFAIREGGRTIGAGVVSKIHA